MAAVLTIPDVAARLRVSRQTVYRRIAAGELTPTNIAERGKRAHLRITEAAYQAYIAARTKQPRRAA